MYVEPFHEIATHAGLECPCGCHAGAAECWCRGLGSVPAIQHTDAVHLFGYCPSPHHGRGGRVACDRVTAPVWQRALDTLLIPTS